MGTDFIECRTIINFIISSITISSLAVLIILQSVIADNNSFTPIACFGCPSNYAAFDSNHATREIPSSSEGRYVGSVMIAPLDEETVVMSSQNKINIGVSDSKYFVPTRATIKHSVLSMSHRPLKRPHVQQTLESGKQNIKARYQPFYSNTANFIYAHKENAQNSVQPSQSISVQSSMPVSSMMNVVSDQQQFQTEPETGEGEVMQPDQSLAVDLTNPQVDQISFNDLTDYSNVGNGYGYPYPYPGYQQPLPDITTPPMPVVKPTDNVGEPPPLPSPSQPAGMPPAHPVATPPVPPPPIGVPVVAPPAVGYYYLGQKFWVVPLFFSVYYIVYVIYLMLRTMKRHKAYYPENLHNAVTEDATTVRMLAEYTTLQLVLSALETFNT